MSPVTSTGSPLQNLTIVFGDSFFLFLSLTVQIGSNMFFFYKSLDKSKYTKVISGHPYKPKQILLIHSDSIRYLSLHHICPSFGMSLEGYLSSSSRAYNSNPRNRLGIHHIGKDSLLLYKLAHYARNIFPDIVECNSWSIYK